VLVHLFFVTVLFAACLLERQYLSGNFEPAEAPFPYEPSPYWKATREAAIQLGWQHAGDFAIKKKTSKVRGLLSLFLNADRTVMAAIFSGASVVAKDKRTTLRTGLATGRVLDSTDSPGTEDLSGVTERAVLLRAGMAELSAFHLRRIENAGALPVSFSSTASLADYQRFDLQKGQRWVQMGLAKWADSQQTSIRMTFRGACGHIKRLFTQMSKLTQQSERIEIPRAGSRGA